ncbi:DUF6777 domain-containing protein [Streptomyces sp. NPDC046215]|uniref:DUF6777 domain-containing protein n=1 Tax=Streptomyces TaxID=1883 RepID=UPI0031DF6F05
MVAALAIFLLRPDGGSGEVFLESASAEGNAPFTRSTAKEPTAEATAEPTPAGGGGGGTRTVQGSTPGLYGGTRNVASCDVERQISYLTEDQAKGRAFAEAAGIEQSTIPAYLRGLTPLQLRADTRVTNHGYKDGKATSYQAVLQAGTSVLVDGKGVPRVRCACGNPLGPPTAVKGTPEPKGQAWANYRKSDVVAVAPATVVIKVIIVYDPHTGEWFERPIGGKGESDRPVPRPHDGVSPGTSRSVEEQPSSAPPSVPPSSDTPSEPTGPTGPTGPPDQPTGQEPAPAYGRPNAASTGGTP